MSGQNDSGGGCFLWFITWIFRAFRNRKIKKYNERSRGMFQQESITTDMLFPSESFQDNIIVSGGGDGERLRFGERIIENCSSRNHAMIILHLGNGSLENVIATKGLGVIAGKNSKIYDPFTSFELPEISQVVLDTCKLKYDIKPAGRYILQIVHDLLTAQKKRPYFANFVNFKFHQIPDRINNCLTAGEITQAQAGELNNLLMMGQAELAKIDTFFYDMQAQIGYMSTGAKGSQSILSTIKHGKTLCVDLSSSANVMLIESIVNTLAIAMNRRYDFSLFIDDVAVANNEMLRHALCQRSAHNNIICSKDLFALLNGKEDVFSAIVGVSDKTVLLSHSSHLSSEKWSKYIGEYDKIDVSYSSSGGFFQSSRWGFVQNQGQTETNKREYKVKPEEINRLPHGQVFVCDHRLGSLIQANVV